MQVLVTLDVFWAERVNLQEKYDDPSKADKMVGTIIQTLARDRSAAANAAPTSNPGGASGSR